MTPAAWIVAYGAASVGGIALGLRNSRLAIPVSLGTVVALAMLSPYDTGRTATALGVSFVTSSVVGYSRDPRLGPVNVVAMSVAALGLFVFANEGRRVAALLAAGAVVAGVRVWRSLPSSLAIGVAVGAPLFVVAMLLATAL